MDQNLKSFIQGMCYAAAELVRVNDEPKAAKDIIRNAGYSLKDLESADVDENDMRVLRPLMVR